MSFDRLVIVGCGAVGGSIGGLVAEAGFPVALVARGEHGRKIAFGGLTVRTPDHAFCARPPCFETIASVDWQQGDVVMLATKLNDAQMAFDELLRNCGSRIPVVCATNGIHAERWAGQRFDNVISMVVWMPSTHLVSGEVLIYGSPVRGILDHGPVNSGDEAALQSVSRQLALWLQRANFDSEVRHDIQSWKHAKWITNLGNAAQALVSDDWKSVATAAQAEGEEVLSQSGLPRLSTAQLLDRCKNVKLQPIDGHRRQGGSTWQSLQRGKPLETPWLEGAMAKFAESQGMSAPLNRFLADVARNPRPLTANEVFTAACVSNNER